MTLLPKACSRHNHIFHLVSCARISFWFCGSDHDLTCPLHYWICSATEQQSTGCRASGGQAPELHLRYSSTCVQEPNYTSFSQPQKESSCRESRADTTPRVNTSSTTFVQVAAPEGPGHLWWGQVNQCWEYMGMWSDWILEEAGEETVCHIIASSCVH